MPLLSRCPPVLTGAALASGVLSAAAGPAFEIVPPGSSGINHIQHKLLLETDPQTFMSGGAAAGDFDGDGHVDLYVTRLDDTDILYRNLGTGSFQDVTAAAFGLAHLATVQSNGCAWGDIDNDGDLDLYVTSIKSNRYHLFVNDGLGQFTEEAALRGADVAGPDVHHGQSVAMGDYDCDGFIDIHVTEWRRDAQNPDAAPHNNRLLRNRGTAGPGSFDDVTVEAGVATDGWPTPGAGVDSQGFSSRFIDLDFDGYPELTIASDHQTSRLFWNNGNGTFTDGTLAARVGTDRFGMGSTFGDIDGDGDFDWFVTSIYHESREIQDGNRLYRYDGGRVFSDFTDHAGVRNGHWGWGAAFFDCDHDGDLDLIQANGVKFPYSPGFSADYENDPTTLWTNDGRGEFTNVAGPGSGIVDTGPGKGLLTFDYDNDGDLDVFIVNNGEAPVLYRNLTGNLGDWIKMRLQGTTSNRDGFGAHVTVIPHPGAPGLIRFADGGSNFLGQSSGIVHFGLGGAGGPALHAVVIRWPSGIVQVLEEVVRNQAIEVVEPAPASMPNPVTVSTTRMMDSGFAIDWPCEPGQRFLVEVSEDCLQWRDFRVVAATGAAAGCIDNARAGIPRRFYRVRRLF